MFTTGKSHAALARLRRRGVVFEWGAVALNLGLLISAAGCSCSGRGGTQEQNRVYATHQFLSSASATKGLGESCVTGGSSDCLSASPICTHFGPNPASNWACSVICTSLADCPSNWDCRTIVAGYVGPDGKLCMPPTNWVPALATVRVTGPSPTKVAGDGTGTPFGPDGGMHP